MKLTEPITTGTLDEREEALKKQGDIFIKFNEKQLEEINKGGKLT